MSGFSFGDTLGSSQSEFSKSLEGNAVHTVKFDGAENHEFPNKKDATAPYRVLRLKFSNDEGSFEHSVFEPRPEDHNRTESKFMKDGVEKVIPNPSNVESMMLLFKHTIDAVNPALGEKIDKGEVALQGKNWAELRNNVIALLAKGIGVETQIKLVKDKNGYARFPGFFTGVNQEGKAYVRNNFIGKNLGFSPYEMTRIKKEEAAKPTEMAFEAPAADDGLGDLDMNFDVAGL